MASAGVDLSADLQVFVTILIHRTYLCVPASNYGISSGMGFIIEYYLIVINIASVKRKIIKPKYPVACSRSVGAAGERDLLWSKLCVWRISW